MPTTDKLSHSSLASALAEYDYARFGLRVLAELPDDGAVLQPSREWSDNELTGRGLNGTSAIRVTQRNIDMALRDAAQYHGAYIVLLGSDESESGVDAGEIVMRSPVVLARWTR